MLQNLLPCCNKWLSEELTLWSSWSILARPEGIRSCCFSIRFYHFLVSAYLHSFKKIKTSWCTCLQQNEDKWTNKDTLPPLKIYPLKGGVSKIKSFYLLQKSFCKTRLDVLVEGYKLLSKTHWVCGFKSLIYWFTLTALWDIHLKIGANG